MKRSAKMIDLKVAHQLKEGSNGLLTHKESIIACYLMGDYTVTQICQCLFRSRNTVKMHIRNMKRKCDCETQTKLGAILQTFIKK